MSSRSAVGFGSSGVSVMRHPALSLTPSGSVTTSANGQVIQNLDIVGNITVNHNDVVIRNNRIRHAGGNGIVANTRTNITIRNVEFINTSAAAGQNPNGGEHTHIHLTAISGLVDIARVKFLGATGIYAANCAGFINISQIRGDNLRGPVSPLRGQLVQLNQCSGGALIEDFTVVNDPNNSWPEDNMSIHECTTGQYTARRGYIDGNNSDTGVGFMIEGTDDCIVEDVDCIRMANGAFSCFDAGCDDNTYRRCRSRENITEDQGRGLPSSGGATFVSWNNALRTVLDDCAYWDVNPANEIVSGAGGTFAATDAVEENFTMRPPLTLSFYWS
jgi:hypothetical protein